MSEDLVHCCIEAPSEYENKARYALKTLLEPLGFSIAWTSTENLPRDPAIPSLYYGPGDGPHGNALSIPLWLSTLDFFSGRRPLDKLAEAGAVASLPQLFSPEARPDGGIPFDVVASAFYWLSGWHEFTTREKDQHGRSRFEDSLQARIGISHQAPVDAYRALLGSNMEARGWRLRPRTWSGSKAAACVTHDIDYDRKWRRGILYAEAKSTITSRSTTGFLRGVNQLASALAEATFHGDPFRRCTRRFVEDASQSGGARTFFFKTAAHGRYDTSYAISGAWARNTVRSITEAGCEVGFHPSYFASDNREYLEAEKAALMNVLQQKQPLSIRSHYLRYSDGVTARLYSDAGFNYDSTLAFAERECFRRGTCLPFEIFDLATNSPTGLWEIPLAVMDSTLFGYRQLDLDEALLVSQALARTCLEYGGVFVVLWHNILWDPLNPSPYGEHYEEMLNFIGENDFYVSSLAGAMDVWG